MGNDASNPPFKKGDGRKKGRPPGSRNVSTQILKDALLIAAEELGEIKRVAVLDEEGLPTGQYEYEYSGHDGLIGYLKWAGIHRPSSFLALLGRILPMQMRSDRLCVDVVHHSWCPPSVQLRWFNGELVGQLPSPLACRLRTVFLGDDFQVSLGAE
jgi:hypothetical protein